MADKNKKHNTKSKQSIKTDKKRAKNRTQQYKHWVITIVKAVEATGEMTKEAQQAYDEFTERYPHAKSILDDLISEVKLLSVYDDEPATVNFEYSAYLQQIQKLVE